MTTEASYEIRPAIRSRRLEPMHLVYKETNVLPLRLAIAAHYRDHLDLEAGLRQYVCSPIYDSVSPFHAVARVLCAGFSGFIFHCVFSRK